MGRDKESGNPAQLAKQKAEEAAAAAAAKAAEGPKRKLNKIKTGVVSSKGDKVVNMGGGASASGASSGSNSTQSKAGDAATTENTLVLKEWQKLPRQLLQQITDKAKAPKPDFQLHRVRGELRGKVKIRMPKGREFTESVYDCPVAATTNQDAYQKAALYALLQLTPTVAHHRVLPDPYRDLWQTWQATPPPLHFENSTQPSTLIPDLRRRFSPPEMVSA